MNRILLYFSAVLSAIVLTGCQKTKVDQEFLNDTNFSLVENGRTIHEYDPLTWQVSYNSSRKEYRVFSDTMSDYYVLTCRETPTSTGEEIHADLKWSGTSIVSKTNLSFRVEKIDPQGRIWLWCKKSKIAVSVMSL